MKFAKFASILALPIAGFTERATAGAYLRRQLD